MPVSIPGLMRNLKIIGLVAFVALLLWGLSFWWFPSRPAAPLTPADLSRLAMELTTLESREQQIAETVWSKELLAQHCGRVVEELWDSLNHTADKIGFLADVAFATFQPGRRTVDPSVGQQILLYRPAGTGPEWTTNDWRRWLNEVRGAGWELDAIEFRHNRFDLDRAGQPERSVFYFAAQLLNPTLDTRAALAGELEVEWEPATVHESLPTLRHIDAQRLTLALRPGPPAFEQVLHEIIAPPNNSFFIDPLILHDLDGDGLSEIILAASNTVFRRQSNGSFDRSALLRHSPGLIFTAVIADFDGDGSADFLCARHDGLHIFRGSARGTFDEPGRLVWSATNRIKYGQVLTCGDVDGDGDLDLWLGQYKSPYERGQMPTPYYDANDGYPAWLLLNNGQGVFSDATEAAGLEAKRFRRSYSGSFVDLDRDGDLDLLVVSDFAGIELYANDGGGRFTDVTHAWIPERHGFGMAHAFADFNRDGLLDFIVTGMHCPTALRLDHLGLSRPGRDDYARFRRVMTAGNRLWIAAPDTGFRQTALNASVANSGWSWGCTTFDCDNDGWPDLYVPNGHETRQSVSDYEPEFWLHDIYVGDSDEDLVKTAYFGAKIARTRGRGWSYGGYEMNRLYLNRQGAEFVEVGHLLGVGLQLDCRSAVADDLDGDGRMDLLVTSFEVWPEVQQTLRVFQNKLESKGNWIGFRFRSQPGRPSPIGVKVDLQTSSHRAIQQVVTGDSHRAQHASTIHFGLGHSEEVQAAVITWPNREPVAVHSPAINRYHLIEAP
jgi:enediyne biosynthesis protein E4